MPASRIQEWRAPLTKEESSFIGDPGKEPAKIGDIAVRTQDLKQYIEYYAATRLLKPPT